MNSGHTNNLGILHCSLNSCATIEKACWTGPGADSPSPRTPIYAHQPAGVYLASLHQNLPELHWEMYFQTAFGKCLRPQLDVSVHPFSVRFQQWITSLEIFRPREAVSQGGLLGSCGRHHCALPHIIPCHCSIFFFKSLHHCAARPPRASIPRVLRDILHHTIAQGDWRKLSGWFRCAKALSFIG